LQCLSFGRDFPKHPELRTPKNEAHDKANMNRNTNSKISCIAQGCEWRPVHFQILYPSHTEKVG